MSVYFAHVNGYMKVGFSENPYSRVGTITSGSSIKPDAVEYGQEVHLLGWIPGDRRTEKAMHRRFAHLHVVGEWFLDDDAFDAELEANEYARLDAMSAQATFLMDHYPDVTRERAIAITEQIAEEKRADPTSELSQIESMFGRDLANDSWLADCRAKRLELRAQTRLRHEVAA